MDDRWDITPPRHWGIVWAVGGAAWHTAAKFSGQGPATSGTHQVAQGGWLPLTKPLKECIQQWLLQSTDKYELILADLSWGPLIQYRGAFSQRFKYFLGKMREKA